MLARLPIWLLRPIWELFTVRRAIVGHSAWYSSRCCKEGPWTKADRSVNTSNTSKTTHRLWLNIYRSTVETWDRFSRNLWSINLKREWAFLEWSTLPMSTALEAGDSPTLLLIVRHHQHPRIAFLQPKTSQQEPNPLTLSRTFLAKQSTSLEKALLAMAISQSLQTLVSTRPAKSAWPAAPTKTAQYNGQSATTTTKIFNSWPTRSSGFQISTNAYRPRT